MRQRGRRGRRGEPQLGARPRAWRQPVHAGMGARGVHGHLGAGRHAGEAAAVPAEAAWALGVGRTTMYRLLAEGAVASVRVGSLRRVPLAALEAYVAGLPTSGAAPG